MASVRATSSQGMRTIPEAVAIAERLGACAEELAVLAEEVERAPEQYPYRSAEALRRLAREVWEAVNG